MSAKKIIERRSLSWADLDILSGIEVAESLMLEGFEPEVTESKEKIFIRPLTNTRNVI